MESEERLTYYPLPLADTEVFSDRNLRKAIKSSGFRMDGSVFGQIVNGAGETLVLLGEGESTAALSETTWDIFRAMDSRSKLTHQRRLFPCEGKFGEIFGRTVTSEHPAYGAWYELSDGFYAGFHDVKSPSPQEVLDAYDAEPREKTSALRIIAETLADIFGWLFR